jgi:hypothetical protein
MDSPNAGHTGPKRDVMRVLFLACDLGASKLEAEPNVLLLRFYSRLILNNKSQDILCNVKYTLKSNGATGDSVELLSVEPSPISKLWSSKDLQAAVEWCAKLVIGTEATDILDAIPKNSETVKIQFNPPNIYDHDLNQR